MARPMPLAAPVTTATLDPAQPGAGKTYATAVNVNLSALDPQPAGPAPKTVDTDAFGNSWDPSALNITSGDTVRWNFPSTEGQPHDVWIYGPGKNPDYNFYRVAGMAIAGKPNGAARNEAEPINVKGLLP